MAGIGSAIRSRKGSTALVSTKQLPTFVIAHRIYLEWRSGCNRLTDVLLANGLIKSALCRYLSVTPDIASSSMLWLCGVCCISVVSHVVDCGFACCFPLVMPQVVDRCL